MSIASCPWLSVVGIGEEGFAVLPPSTQNLCAGAKYILGAKRHIASLPQELASRAESWLSPFAENLTRLDALQAELSPSLSSSSQKKHKQNALSPPPVCVLATGDPLSYGVGATLVRRYGVASLQIVPWCGSVSLAAARMGWAHDSFATLSLHGRPLAILARSLAPCARLLVLLSGIDDVRRVAALLSARNLESSALTLLSRLGSAQESLLSSSAERIESDLKASRANFSNLTLLALELPAQPSRVSASGTFGARLGLPDEAFVHDGQITKRHVRALTLAALVVQRDALLWDIGAGAGSIAVEWCYAGGRAHAVEQNAGRIAFIKENSTRFAIDDRVQVFHASAQEFVSRAKEQIEKGSATPPQAVFLGGGLDSELVDQLLALLAPHGRFVANAVSLHGEAVLSDAYLRHGGELVRVAVAHAQALGASQAFAPQRAVMQYVKHDIRHDSST